MAYTGASEIVNMGWSPKIGGLAGVGGQGHTTPGEWIAIAMGKSVRALKV